MTSSHKASLRSKSSLTSLSPGRSGHDTKSDLEPNAELLAQIFPEPEPASTTILSQDFENCVFIAHFNHVSEQASPSPSPSSGKDVVVRLNLPSDRSRTVSAMQRLGALALPDLVPAVERTGAATMQDGRELEFCVTSFVADAVALGTVWDELAEEQQARIMDVIVSMVKQVQALDLGSKSVRKVLQGVEGALWESAKRDNGGPSSAVLGSPTTGFFEDLPDLIDGIIAANGDVKQEPSCTVKQHPNGDGIVVSSANDKVHIPQAEIASLERRIVFCHNDLEPRRSSPASAAPPSRATPDQAPAQTAADPRPAATVAPAPTTPCAG